MFCLRWSIYLVVFSRTQNAGFLMAQIVPCIEYLNLDVRELANVGCAAFKEFVDLIAFSRRSQDRGQSHCNDR